MPNNTALERYKGCLLGLACGDAVGTTLEFAPRDSHEPLTDMVGGGPFNLEAGQWTDDTSMALCLAASLIEDGSFNPKGQMRRYLSWYRHGYMSSTGTCFDIGNTTMDALERFEKTGDPYSGSFDPQTAGNGSLMRLAPVVMRYGNQHTTLLDFAEKSSATTHAAPEAMECCQLLAKVIASALQGSWKEDLLDGAEDGLTQSRVIELARGNWRFKQRDQIRSNGYCVDSLEAAFWCAYNTLTFQDAVLMAANLGDDADTTAAIAGQIAGALWGINGIPPHWREKLHKRELIEDMAEKLYLLADGEVPTSHSTASDP